VQVDPIKPTLKAPGTRRLKLKCDILRSTSSFKFNLRRYKEGVMILSPERKYLISILSPQLRTETMVHMNKTGMGSVLLFQQVEVPPEDLLALSLAARIEVGTIVLCGATPSSLRNWGVQFKGTGFLDPRPTPGRPISVPARVINPQLQISVMYPPDS